MLLPILTWVIGAGITLAEPSRCAAAALEGLRTAGFEVAALCDRGESITEVTITLRQARREETGTHRIARELRELELSFSGSLVRVEAPSGWKIESTTRAMPLAVVVRWTREGAAANRLMEKGRGAFKVWLSGADAGVSCTHRIETDVLGAGTVCGLPPVPPNKPLQPTGGANAAR